MRMKKKGLVVWIVVCIFSLITISSILGQIYCPTCQKSGNCIGEPLSYDIPQQSDFPENNALEKFTDPQWNEDEADGKKGVLPDKPSAKDNHENWKSATPTQANQMDTGVAANDPKNGQYLYNKWTDDNKRNDFLSKITGKDVKGDLSDTQYFRRGDENWIKVGDTYFSLDEIPEGTQTIEISQLNRNPLIIYSNNEKSFLNAQLGTGICPWRRTNPAEEEYFRRLAERGYISPQAGPSPDPSKGFGGGGGGGSGEGERGGGSEIGQAFQQVFQLISQMSGSLGPLADVIESNGQGKTSVSGPNQYGGVTAELSSGAETGFMRGGKETLIVAQNEKDEKAKVELDGNEPIAHLENTDSIVPQQLIAKTPIKSTTLELNGINGNDPSNPPVTDREVYASPQLSPITAQAIAQEEVIDFGQYIKLKEHDLDISGEDITIYALKTFNDVVVGGQNLKVFTGDIEMKFEGQRIFYPRLVKNAPYGFAQIQNKLDQNNKFKLQHYTNKKSSLTDNKEILSISDITTRHPRNDLIISKIRLSMWETS